MLLVGNFHVPLTTNDHDESARHFNFKVSEPLSLFDQAMTWSSTCLRVIRAGRQRDISGRINFLPKIICRNTTVSRSI